MKWEVSTLGNAQGTGPVVLEGQGWGRPIVKPGKEEVGIEKEEFYIKKHLCRKQP